MSGSTSDQQQSAASHSDILTGNASPPRAPRPTISPLPTAFDARALKDHANAALEHPAISAPQISSAEPDVPGRDSSSNDLHNDRPEKRHRPSLVHPLTLRTQQSSSSIDEETIATSPNLSKHVIQVTGGAETTLPAMHTALPTRDGNVTSPQSGKLPPLHQITGEIKIGLRDPLNAFAEVAALQQPQIKHHHSYSFGSATSPSPTTLYQSYSGAQASPSAHFPLIAPSPPNVASEHIYGSPPRHPSSAYYADRRPSVPIDLVPKLQPSLPSASSSGESQGHASSTTEGSYSTAQTTPSELTTRTAEGTPRPTILPPPPGMPLSGYKCDYDGCTAPLFQTQYLLSSHKNVHSENRTHFCPWVGCARGEGGKGFKRKNEMIRHQLVHKSPGYVCPFCPDREHKYPRPDNLQRHVRVHHVDKDRDDPQLCEVLAKRNGGGGKARRRRTTSGSA